MPAIGDRMEFTYIAQGSLTQREKKSSTTKANHKMALTGAVVKIIAFDGLDGRYKVNAPCPSSRRRSCNFWVREDELEPLTGKPKIE